MYKIIIRAFISGFTQLFNFMFYYIGNVIWFMYNSHIIYNEAATKSKAKCWVTYGEKDRNIPKSASGTNRNGLAGAHRSRTYRRHRRVPTNGFEVRGVHRGPSAPINYNSYTLFSKNAIYFLDDHTILTIKVLMRYGKAIG